MLSEGPTDEESAILSQHATYVEQLTRQGVVELAGRTQNADETAFGLVVFRAKSETAARQIMLDDPAVKHGVMTASLFPYRVAYRSAGMNGAA
jgi:uncharacterized protein YciI